MLRNTTIEQLLQAVAATLPDPIFIIDENGQYLEVIGGGDRSLYTSGEYLKEKYLHDVLPKETADTFIKLIQDSIATKSFKAIDYQLDPNDLSGVKNDGPEGVKWYEGRVYPITDSAFETPIVAWTALNITARKELELKLKELSETDPLTGAFNRRYFFNEFKKFFNLAKRYHYQVALLLIDIDRFKHVNDRYGHLTGDAVIIQLTRCAMSLMRETDVFARIGGEEFATLLPNTSMDEAVHLAERLRKEIADMEVIHEVKRVSVTVSIGLSHLLREDEGIEAILARADQALYEAKNKGRNRVMKRIASDTP